MLIQLSNVIDERGGYYKNVILGNLHTFRNMTRLELKHVTHGKSIPIILDIQQIINNISTFYPPEKQDEVINILYEYPYSDILSNPPDIFSLLLLTRIDTLIKKQPVSNNLGSRNNTGPNSSRVFGVRNRIPYNNSATSASSLVKNHEPLTRASGARSLIRGGNPKGGKRHTKKHRQSSKKRNRSSRARR